MKELWEVVETKSSPRWLELRDPAGHWEAIVKADGCVEVHTVGQLADDPADGDWDRHIHICDLDDFLSRMQALRTAAAAYFGEWPDD